MLVTFASGETAVMDRPEFDGQWNLKPLVLLLLAPGESGQQAAGWEHGSMPNWFSYASFSAPGTYGIALDLQIVDKYKKPLAAVRTAAVTLTRVEPVGIDAALWERMQAISRGQWAAMSFQSSREGECLRDEIIRLHPASSYYPYALAMDAMRPVDKSRLPILFEAAERFAESPARPYLLLAAADGARYAAKVTQRMPDAAAVLTNFRLARSNYREALATKSFAVRASAERALLTLRGSWSGRPSPFGRSVHYLPAARALPPPTCR